MVAHHGGDALIQYLGSFILYTFLSIGAIYGAYWYMRRHVDNPANRKPQDPNGPLKLEATLALEPNKNLYVVRSGNERFLISISADTTQLLSRLEDVPKPVEAVVQEPVPTPVVEAPKPWFVETPPPVPVLSARQRFGQRLLQSMRWLAESRMKSPAQALARRK